MGIFKKKKQVPTYSELDEARINADPFTFEMPVSGGNIFEAKINHNNKIEKTLNVKWVGQDTPNLVDNELNSCIADKQLSWYFHLLLEARYYTNTINFEVDDTHIFRQLKKMINNAFLLGRCGMYYDVLSTKWVAVNIIEIKYERGEISSAKISFDTEINEENIDGTWKTNNPKNIIDANVENLFIFQWDTYGYGAYVLMKPYIHLKKQMIDQITVSSILSLKQVEYISDDEQGGKEELKHWLNPLSWFVFKRKRSRERINIIETEQMIARQQALMDNYVQTCDIYNDMYGRRNNVDAKKERNITSEVDASQEQFDCLQKEWIDNFKCFVEDINKHPNFNTQINVVEQEMENQDEDNSGDGKDVPDISKPDNSNE